jgi:hypothetical protein
MKLKKHNYHIKVRLRSFGADMDIYSTFIIKAVKVDHYQAMKIANILYPEFIIKNVEVKNSL